MKIHDANKNCEFNGRKFFFDTNVWMAIYGNDSRPERKVYSNYYKSIIETGNEVVVSDCIISEFFNRAVKIEYGMLYEDQDYKKLKSRRQDVDFLERMESVKDTCLDILEGSSVCLSAFLDGSLEIALETASKGEADFTDAMIINFCNKSDFILVTHDYDFKNCEIDIVTANKKFLKTIKP